MLIYSTATGLNEFCQVALFRFSYIKQYVNTSVNSLCNSLLLSAVKQEFHGVYKFTTPYCSHIVFFT